MADLTNHQPGSDPKVGAQPDALKACLQLERAESDRLERSQSRRRLIVTRWLEGALAREIAEELDTSKSAVTAEMFAMRRSGIPLPQRPGGRGRPRPHRTRAGQIPLTTGGGRR